MEIVSGEFDDRSGIGNRKCRPGNTDLDRVKGFGMT